MKFSVVVEQVLDLLQRQGRISSRMLKREFDLDDEVLADLKEELLYSHAQQVREEGPGLVWTGRTTEGEKAKWRKGETDKGISNNTEGEKGKWQNGEMEGAPDQWTPPHLAERIRAEQAALEARGATDGERKTITALFADLRGSTALIEGLDPEEARAIIDPALQLRSCIGSKGELLLQQARQRGTGNSQATVVSREKDAKQRGKVTDPRSLMPVAQILVHRRV
jgi:hypothetical protein